MPIKDVNAKRTQGKGFGNTPQSPTGQQQEGPNAQEFALTFASAAEGNLAKQFEGKAQFLQGLDGMIDNAVDAIAHVEEDILSGNCLERKLAERRSQYAFNCVQDASVSLEFSALTTLEALAKPAEFPAVAETLKAISPAQKQQLDQAVLSPAK